MPKNSKLYAIIFVVSASLVAISLSTDRAQSATENACGPNGTDTAPCNLVHGFAGNSVLPGKIGATIGGGGDRYFPNQITGDYGTIGGGQDNQAGDRATVAGGSSNSAPGFRSTVGGGSNNAAVSGYSTIAGGTNNTASHVQATIGGGTNNTASGRDSVVAGGSGNIAGFTEATVSGGAYNTSSGLEASIGGGSRNLASGTYATISGGTGNKAEALDTTVSGGSGNAATADDATVTGGLSNRATEKYSTVGGGYKNMAGNANDDPRDGEYATVAGGANNNASGAYASIPGGSDNVAAGAYSVATGRRALATDATPGAFVFADSTDREFRALSPNEFAARAVGGVRFVTGVDASGNATAGVQLAPGGGAWQALSDRAAKANFRLVDGEGILEQLARMPITTWNYKAQDASLRHIGPTAQDFAHFGFGESDKYINEADANGVALAAIQGLNQIVTTQGIKINELEAANLVQLQKIDALNTRVTALENGRASGTSEPTLTLSIGLLGLVTGLLVRRR